MITFKQFLAEDSKGRHGEYVGDVAEKTMIHTIINILFGGQKTDEHFDEAYSFIEAPSSEKFYEKFYGAFVEKAAASEAKRKGEPEVQISPAAGKLLGEFKNQLKITFNTWKNAQKKKNKKESTA